MRHSSVFNDQGFTILELIVIVIIVGILAAFSAPGYLAWSQRKKVDSALTSIEGAMKEAQRQAIAKSITCNVTLDTSPPKVRSTTTSNCLLTGDRTLTSVSLTASATSVNFDYLGNSSSEITVVVSPASNPNFKKCLVLSTPLGLIRTGKYSGSGTNSANCTQ
ncbi:prepilin-type N-terminal cleavage/methylation domain-containing protein [Sphaerospermopsis aphanizomenoides BCCUSP55]|uniref:prepilin-type N-terminal cleavage/methylation domain-containing protein n=1 Tax=Sphaerospermopsis aphanizomenoides TaxID=459663 RepID=UPI0019077A8E|nr:prepilin-type N-terminal cleavage/methylation domain-containing protein [Sphaerospermopsis aphanizomenoides]MBK1989839.1 prepilin-type N-terminal cleavage/methylation domain-containing protein [Sphaerospermopsis aphanizomenoides BCCUSP55]